MREKKERGNIKSLFESKFFKSQLYYEVILFIFLAHTRSFRTNFYAPRLFLTINLYLQLLGLDLKIPNRTQNSLK